MWPGLGDFGGEEGTGNRSRWDLLMDETGTKVTSDSDNPGTSGGGWEAAGERSGERGCAASCGGHIWRLPWRPPRAPLVLGWRKRALMRGSCGRAAGTHLFCFQHQRPEKKWLSSPEGHGHPSWRLHCQEAGPHGQCLLSARSPHLPGMISCCSLRAWPCTRPSRPAPPSVPPRGSHT